MSPIRVVSIRNTCPSCPSQWQGVDRRGRVVYVRYRYGSLTIGIGPSLNTAVANGVGATAVLRRKVGGPWDGTMTFARLRRFGRGRIVWPKTAAGWT